MRWVSLVLAAGAAWGQGAALERARGIYEASLHERGNWLAKERIEWFNEKGKKTRAEAGEVLWVEGERHRRLVEVNGKAVAGEEWESILRKAREKGWRASRFGLFESLGELYTVGPEERDGGLVRVVAEPRGMELAKTDADRDLLRNRKRFWVDPRTGAMVKLEAEVVRGGGAVGVGTKQTMEYGEIAPGVWMMTGSVTRVRRAESEKWEEVRVKMSDWKRFGAESVLKEIR